MNLGLQLHVCTDVTIVIEVGYIVWVVAFILPVCLQFTVKLKMGTTILRTCRQTHVYNTAYAIKSSCITEVCVSVRIS